MKKFITLAMAASLVLGSMPATAYAATFADINTVTWSGFKPYLEEAAELKLMSGYDENGKKYCKPRNNVTYCEAVQLMYSIMKVYNKQDVSDTTVTKWKPVMSAYNIPDWAYKATAFGLENSILSTSDLNKLQGNAKKVNEKPATREDVGMIFGKAIAMIDGYDIKSNASLSYKDTTQIVGAAVPYLELLGRVDLMVGDTDNRFNPKANISRAEMAVLSVKSYKKLSETKVTVPETPKEETIAATVSSTRLMANGDLFLSLTLNNGDSLNLFAVKGSVTAKYEGDTINFSDIGAGDTVKIKYKDTNITSLEVSYSKRGIEKTRELKTELVDISKNKVKVEEGSKEKEYRLDDDVTLKLEGKKTTIDKLQEALDEASYDVTMVLDADDYVLELNATMNENNPTEGYVDDVSEDEIVLKIGTRTYKYPLTEDVEIEYDGKTVRFSKFEKDYEDFNYYVSLKLDKNNEVTEIIIESMEDEYSGTLTFINSKRIELEAGGETYKYDLADDVDVEIDDDDSSVSKLREKFNDDIAYTVSVELNRDDEVTEIIAVTKYSGNNSGELKELDDDEITVIVDEKKYSYDLAEEVDVEINGKSSDLEELQEFFGEYAFTVELKFNNKGEVEEIEATIEEVAEGILRDIVDDDRITIKAVGMSVDLDLASDVDVTLDGEEMTLDELNDQQDYADKHSQIHVELEYDSKGKVDEIEAFWVDASGTLKSVDEEEDEITIDEDGDDETYALARKAEIIYKVGASADADDYEDEYDNDLDGLQEFLEDCKKAKDECTVMLTLNKDDDITRLIATAK